MPKLAVLDIGTNSIHMVLAEVQPDFIHEVLGQHLVLPRARERVVLELERRYCEQVLGEHGGNVTHAAAASGIARRYFQHIHARSKRPSADGESQD